MEQPTPVDPSPGARGPWLALACGAIPAVVVFLGERLGATWAEGILQPTDLAVAVGVLLVGVLLGRAATGSLLDSRGIGWVVPLALVPGVLAMAVLGGPITNDEQAYRFQAELQAEGRMVEALPTNDPDSPLLDTFRRRQVHEDTEEGVRFSKYAPGSSLALTPLAALGLPPLATTILLGILDLFLVGCLARRLGLGRPVVAVALLATSPFFLLVSTGWQSQVFTTPAVLGLALALVRLRQQGEGLAMRDAVLLGTLSGWVFLVRPLTGVVLAAAAALAVLTWRVPPPRRLGTLALAVVGGLPFLATMLWWNQQLTGSWSTSVYELYAAKYGPFDPAQLPQKVPVDVYGQGDPLLGLLRQAGRWSVAFGGMLGAIGLALVGCWRLRKSDGGFSLAVALLLPLAYAFHWYPGHRAYLGPLYAFETLGLLLLGLLAWRRSSSYAGRDALLVAMLACGGIAFTFRWPLIADEAQARSMPQRVAVEAPAGSVVFLPPQREGRKELAFKYWTPSSPRALLDPESVLILRTSGRMPPARLIAELGLQGRTLFLLEPDPEDSREGRLVPFEP
jgi:hypothetical protein